MRAWQFWVLVVAVLVSPWLGHVVTSEPPETATQPGEVLFSEGLDIIHLDTFANSGIISIDSRREIAAKIQEGYRLHSIVTINGEVIAIMVGS